MCVCTCTHIVFFQFPSADFKRHNFPKSFSQHFLRVLNDLLYSSARYLLSLGSCWVFSPSTLCSVLSTIPPLLLVWDFNNAIPTWPPRKEGYIPVPWKAHRQVRILQTLQTFSLRERTLIQATSSHLCSTEEATKQGKLKCSGISYHF